MKTAITIICIILLIIPILAYAADESSSQVPEWTNDQEKWLENKDWGFLTRDKMEDADAALIKKASQHQALDYFSTKEWHNMHGIDINTLKPNEIVLIQKAYPKMKLPSAESLASIQKEGSKMKISPYYADLGSGKEAIMKGDYEMSLTDSYGKVSTVHIRGDTANTVKWDANENGVPQLQIVKPDGEKIIVQRGLVDISPREGPNTWPPGGIELQGTKDNPTGVYIKNKNGEVSVDVTAPTVYGDCREGNCFTIKDKYIEARVLSDNQMTIHPWRQDEWSAKLLNTDITDGSRFTYGDNSAKSISPLVTIDKAGVHGTLHGGPPMEDLAQMHLEVSDTLIEKGKISVKPSPPAPPVLVGQSNEETPLTSTQLDRATSQLKSKINSPFTGGIMNQDGDVLLNQQNGGGVIISRSGDSVYDYKPSTGGWSEFSLQTGKRVRTINPRLDADESLRQLMRKVSGNH